MFSFQTHRWIQESPPDRLSASSEMSLPYPPSSKVRVSAPPRSAIELSARLIGLVAQNRRPLTQIAPPTMNPPLLFWVGVWNAAQLQAGIKVIRSIWLRQFRCFDGGLIERKNLVGVYLPTERQDNTISSDHQLWSFRPELLTVLQYRQRDYLAGVYFFQFRKSGSVALHPCGRSRDAHLGMCQVHGK